MTPNNSIQERTFQFGIQIIKLAKFLPRNTTGFVLSHQLIRSGTSIGANITEAQDAASRADFIHYITISLKEARETEYWLRLLVESETVERGKIAAALEEIEEIVKILRASVKKLKKGRS